MTDVWTNLYAAGGGAIRNGGVELFGGDSVGNTYAFALSSSAHDLTTPKIYYFELTILDLFLPSDASAGFGVGTTNGGAAATDLNIWSNGKFYLGGVPGPTPVTLPPTGLNGIVDVAVGKGNIWLRVDGGPWNGNPAADPIANIGGHPVPAAANRIFGGTYGPWDATVAGKYSQITINTSQPFVHAMPAGAEAWSSAIVPIDPGPPNVSAQSPNPPTPNSINPGHTTGIKWTYPGIGA